MMVYNHFAEARLAATAVDKLTRKSCSGFPSSRDAKEEPPAQTYLDTARKGEEPRMRIIWHSRAPGRHQGTGCRLESGFRN